MVDLPDVDRYRLPHPDFDYENRVRRLATRARAADIDAVLIPYYVDLLYFTGTAQPANLYVPADDPERARVFVRRAMGFARQEVGLPTEMVVDGGLEALADYAGDVGTVGLPLDVVPAAVVRRIETALDAEATDVSDVVLEVRARKTPDEVALLEEGAALYEHAHEAILDRAAPGVSEKAVAGAVADALLSAGAGELVCFRRWDARLPFPGLVVSGDTLASISGHAMTVTGVGATRMVPWGPSTRNLERGDVVVADLGLNYAGYHGDIARTYVVGEAAPAQREWFDLTSAIFEAALAALEPGAPAEAPYRAALAEAEAAGVADWLCGYAEMQAPYVGHAVGLEIDEPPTLALGNDRPLEPGMVVTLEPKLIHPDRGAAMLEDDFLVTEDGVERLSPVPLDLFEIPVDET